MAKDTREPHDGHTVSHALFLHELLGLEVESSSQLVICQWQQVVYRVLELLLRHGRVPVVLRLEWYQSILHLQQQTPVLSMHAP